jgi:hypothetical protein
VDEFQKWVRKLKKKFPLLLPVRVHRRDLSKTPDAGGSQIIYSSNGKPEAFLVVIHKSSKTLMYHMLIHEWAHVYSWQLGHNMDDHGIEWALAMSKIYQYLVEK